MWLAELLGLTRQQVSDIAGSASFVVWLFAQSPQLFENYCNSSCDGLSIVFLIQWMAGDVTNLIGCVLTGQLPFQIAVATYFCSIDLCILLQYYYYWQRDRQLATQRAMTASIRSRHARQYSSTMPSMRSSSIQTSSLVRADRRVSVSPSTSVHRNEPAVRKTRPSLQYYPHSRDSAQRYQALSQTAKSFSDMAKEYAQRIAHRDAGRSIRAGRGDKKSKGGKLKRSTSSDSDDDRGEVPARMMESVRSDSSRGSDNFGYGFGTASTMLEEGYKPCTTIPSSPDTDLRGRDMSRTAGKIQALSAGPPSLAGTGANVDNVNESTTSEHSEGSAAVPQTPISGFDAAGYVASPTQSRSNSRRTTSKHSTRSPAATRGTGIILLGVLALFGLRDHNLTMHSRSLAISDGLSPRALSVPVEELSTASYDNRPVSTVFGTHIFPSPPVSHREPLPLHEVPPPPTWERIVGRISAWTCTLLYLTSRLPQIWTNWSRRSVQGLSVLLFLSAALGNALYTISILANPLATGNTRLHYLMESLPFLLGSGGTLFFDAIIVTQWVAWRGKSPILEAPHYYPSERPSAFLYRNSSRASRTDLYGTGRRQWSSLERQPLMD